MDNPTQTTASKEPVAQAGLVLDIASAASFLGLTPWQVRGLIASKELSVLKVGRKFYLRKTSLARWCELYERTAA